MGRGLRAGGVFRGVEEASEELGQKFRSENNIRAELRENELESIESQMKRRRKWQPHSHLAAWEAVNRSPGRSCIAEDRVVKVELERPLLDNKS